MQFALMISFSFNYQHFLCWHVRHAPNSCLFEGCTMGSLTGTQEHMLSMEADSEFIPHSHFLRHSFPVPLLLVFPSNVINRNSGRAEGAKVRRVEIGIF